MMSKLMSDLPKCALNAKWHLFADASVTKETLGWVLVGINKAGSNRVPPALFIPGIITNEILRAIS